MKIIYAPDGESVSDFEIGNFLNNAIVTNKQLLRVNNQTVIYAARLYRRQGKIQSLQIACGNAFSNVDSDGRVQNSAFWTEYNKIEFSFDNISGGLL